MLVENKKIGIVGGGPGGLTLARLLQNKGLTVKVYERDLNPEVRVQGATLDLHHDSGLKALEKAGLLDAFKSQYRPGADRIRILDEHGRIHFDQHNENTEETFGDPWFRPEIDRGPLRKLLLESLKPNTVEWNSHILSLERSGAGWQIKGQNGTFAYADIVIAADGANSKVRPFLTSIRPFYTGVTALEGTIYDAAARAPYMTKLVQGGKIFAFGDSKTLIVSAKGDGSLSFYTGFKVALQDNDRKINTGNKAQIANWFEQEYAGWNPMWQELFVHPDTDYVLRPLFCMPLDQSWEAQSNITMLGDAAHLMPPYAGEGVNMAMLNALELSQALTSLNFPDVRMAIAYYEEQMLKNFRNAAAMSLENTEWMHAPGGLQQMLQMFK